MLHETDEIMKDLMEINRQTCLNIFHMVSVDQQPKGLSPRLVIPLYSSSGQPRISEQEARFLFCEVVNGTQYYYSIETPTKEKYSNQAERESIKRSALTDATLWRYTTTGFEKTVNVEFKGLTPAEEEIEKDLRSLLYASQVPCTVIPFPTLTERPPAPGSTLFTIHGTRVHCKRYTFTV